MHQREQRRAQGWWQSTLDAALRFEEAELLSARAVLEQDGHIVETRLITDNVPWNDLKSAPSRYSHWSSFAAPTRKRVLNTSPLSQHDLKGTFRLFCARGLSAAIETTVVMQDCEYSDFHSALAGQCERGCAPCDRHANLLMLELFANNCRARFNAQPRLYTASSPNY
jgi:hypothetical protein